jgi:hypothetical protein
MDGLIELLIVVALDTKSLPESNNEDGDADEDEDKEKESDEKGIEDDEESSSENLNDDTLFDNDFDLEGTLNILGLDDFLSENKLSVLLDNVLYNPSDERGDEPNNLFELDFIRLENLLLKSLIDIIVYNYRL